MEQVMEKTKTKRKKPLKSVAQPRQSTTEQNNGSGESSAPTQIDTPTSLDKTVEIPLSVDVDSCEEFIEESTTLLEHIDINNEIEEIAEEVTPDNKAQSTVQPDEFRQILDSSRHLINEIELQELNDNIKNSATQKQELPKIRPYSESQLSALYTNSELEMIESFTSHYVEAELKGLATKHHPLYELLSNYLQVRYKIAGNTLELEQFRKEYRDLQATLWTTDIVSITGRGECQDGNQVSAVHSYQKATFHRSIFQSIVRVLGLIRKLTYDNHVLYAYSAEDLRLQIELYIQTAISNCMKVSGLDGNSPVILSLQNESLHLKPYLAEVRLCISVLFAFQRKLIRDAQFLKETREWLSRLIGVLLRLATYQDHLFILNHILRCPPGVGAWAAPFVQAPLDENPDSPFSSYQVNHVLSILASILMPVKQRDKFLEDICQPRDLLSGDSFVVVDSDGEEDDESGSSLRENDLVALLTQLPLESLFRAVLLVENKNFENSYDFSKVSQHHILRFLAFSTALLKIINKGLLTYNQSRYNQFAKRLSRLIRHIVQYATDQWEQFRRSNRMTDEAMKQRLQIEYDAFFLRAIYYLYTAQKLGAWQFLAVVPYDVISTSTLWKIFYFLHDCDSTTKDILDPCDDKQYCSKLWEPVFRAQFEEKISRLADDELYYLLNTFANMALSRNSDDMDFIEIATKDLLQIGFISQNTQDMCSKSSRTLLTHITSKHPHLLSPILHEIKENIASIGNLGLYLYEELPLTVWEFTQSDFIIVSLLLNDINSIESKLARMILSRLDWDILPYEMHCNVALLVLRVCNQEPGYVPWAWQMILRLKLHLNDKACQDIAQIKDPEHFDEIMKGIRQQQPLASFVALLMTSWGHLVPLICTQGLSQIAFLQYHQKHEAVLFVLYLVVPLFVNCQEYIINNDKFQEIIQSLINADRGYISMAKSLISVQSTTVLQQFGNMIETQLVNYTNYGLDSPRFLVRLWMNTLASTPGWNRDPGVMYLLDVIVRAAFFHVDALDAAQSVLRDLQECNSTQEQGGTISSIFKWVSNSTSTGSLISGSLVNWTWLAYLVIDIDFEDKEKRTGLWTELLLQLNNQKGKVSVDGAIKKAASTLKLAAFSSGNLCIYRWAQQAMDTAIDHPLLPLIWQKFFTLYLARISLSHSADIGCVGDKFFEGLVNFSFFKRIKRKLQDTLDYYQEMVRLKAAEDFNLERRTFIENSLRLFKAFMLWLEEPKLQRGNLLLQSLPPTYQSNLLAFIMQGNTSPWYQYLDYDRIKKQQMECVKIWKISNFRYKNNINKPLPNPGNTMESDDPVERILRRLTVYENPKAPPDIKNTAPIVPVLDFSNRESLFGSLEPCFRTLKQFAHNQVLKVSEHKALDCSYQELVQQLYRSVFNKVTKKTPCKGRHETVNCSGAALIILEVQEARINERIEQEIDTNRNAYESLLTKSLQAPALALCTASLTIQQAIKVLQSQVRCNPATVELGSELFYHILSLINEETSAYLPTKTLFSSCIEKLGRSHISGNEYEMPRLLERILKEPAIGGYLAPHFTPSNVGTSNLLYMYSIICKEIGINYDVTFALLSKFDVDNWLTTKQPKLSQRSEFIRSVIKALTVLGYEPPVEALVLHGLYRRHLLSVFEFQFPEHYGEILVHLLKASNGNTDTCLLSKSVWLDILNSLSKPVQMEPKMPLRDQLRQYAQHQMMLQHQELLETAELFSQHFTQERLQYGLYGLYPKCRNYIDVFAILLGMTGHGLIVSMLNTHQGLLCDKLSQKVWPYLISIFSPWIVPYSMQNVKEDMASWIQQLADDRTILLPWIPTDVPFAQKIIGVFFECVQFLIHTLPACGNILSFIWQWYVASFAHVAVKEHVLAPIHQAFLAFPWDRFWPSLSDLECMTKIIDQYLPECHSFLGHIFILVPWTAWLNNFKEAAPPIKARVYHCFINLLVKLSNEPKIRNKYPDRAKTLLVEAENFDWTLLEPVSLQRVMDWYVMSCDPSVIFKADPLNLDFRVLHFLKTASGYGNVSNNTSASGISKRVVYIKSFVKLVSVYTSKHKATISTKESDITTVINQQLHHLDEVVRTQEEFNIILHELLAFVNIQGISSVSLKCFGQWISNKMGDSMAIKGMLQVTTLSVNGIEPVADLLEMTLTSYFQNSVIQSFNPSWKEIGLIVNFVSDKQADFEQTLLDKSSLLSLNALLIQRIKKGGDSAILLNMAIDWFASIKISERDEPKIPLLWFEILQLSLVQCERDEPAAGAILYKFAKTLLQVAEEKAGSRWGKALSVIGINKQDTISIQFLCRCMAGFILAQLPEMKGEQQVVRRQAHAAAKVGQPGGNTECTKVLMSLSSGQSQGKIKECEELALNQIQDAANSMHNATQFLGMLVKQFYIKPFLREIA